MIRLRFILLFGLISSVSFAQKDYKGLVVDAVTKQPIPYVNIGVFGKGIGTVSDEEGIFHLTLDRSKLTDLDSVQFSSLGYETYKIEVPKLQYVYSEYPEILLKPKRLELNEAIVTDKGAYAISDVVGYQNYGEKTFGYWKDNVALGGELATKIKVRKGLRRLNTLFFEVFSNPSDSVLIRVNFYNIGSSKGIPGENLNLSGNSILHTLYPNSKLAIVDLTPYAIYVKDDFFVSLELLKVSGQNPIGLILAASQEENTYSIRKFASLDNWEVLPQSAMAYYLNTTYFSSKKRAESKVVKAQRSKQNITGFIFSSRRPISNVRVTNLTTNEETFSNAKGNYSILGEKNDIIQFTVAGYKQMTIKLIDKTRININLPRK